MFYPYQNNGNDDEEESGNYIYMNESLTSTNRNVLNKLDSVQKQQIILLKAIQ